MTDFMLSKGITSEPGSCDMGMLDPSTLKEHMEELAKYVYLSCAKHNFKFDDQMMSSILRTYKDFYVETKPLILDKIWGLACSGDGMIADSRTTKGAASIISITKALVQKIKRDARSYMLLTRSNELAYCIHVDLYRNFDMENEDRNWITFVWLLDKTTGVVYVQLCRK